MSAVVETNRGGSCGICLQKFEAGDQQLTHVGGEKHNGFHRTCLAGWLARQSICPYDRQSIDSNSLVSRTDRIMIRLRPALISAAYAGCFGTALAAVGTAVAGGEVAAGAIVTGAVGARVAGVGVVMLVGTITIGALTAGAGARAIATGTALIAGGGGAVGRGIDWILNRRGVTQIARENIGLGIQIGAIAGFAATLFEPLAALPIVAVVGSVTTGILSLIRGE